MQKELRSGGGRVSVKKYLNQGRGSGNATVLELRLRDNHKLPEGEGGTAFWAREQHPQRLGGLKVRKVF